MLIPRFVATALLITTATIGWSQTSPEDHAGHHPPEKGQATTLAAESKDAMAATRGLIERAEHAATASERERLLDEHLAAMRKQLDALKSQQCMMEKMDGAAMSGGPSDGAKMGKMGEGMEGDHMKMCHQMMEARMETMAELLEQTWRREELRKKGAK
jgi:hypothetical protein